MSIRKLIAKLLYKLSHKLYPIKCSNGVTPICWPPSDPDPENKRRLFIAKCLYRLVYQLDPSAIEKPGPDIIGIMMNEDKISDNANDIKYIGELDIDRMIKNIGTPKIEHEPGGEIEVEAGSRVVDMDIQDWTISENHGNREICDKPTDDKKNRRIAILRDFYKSK